MMKKFGILLLLILPTLILANSLELLSQEEIIRLNQREVRLDQVLWENWSGSNWHNSMKAKYQYNELGLISQLKAYQYNSNQWFLYQLQLIEYDEQGNISNFTVALWDSGSWNNITKVIQTYNPDNSYDSITQLSWNSYFEEWENEQKDQYFYNNNLLEHVMTQTWNSIEWLDQYNAQYYYDEANNLIEIITSGWLVNEWILNSRKIYAYEDNTSPTEKIDQYWFIDDWTNNARETYLYNGAEQISEIIAYSWLEDWNNNLITTFEYNLNNDTESVLQMIWDEAWIDNQRATYQYIEVSAEPDYYENDYSSVIYPNVLDIRNNPDLKLSLKIASIDQLDIFNLRGQKISSVNIENQVARLNNLNLTSGVYLIALKKENEVITIRKISIIK